MSQCYVCLAKDIHSHVIDCPLADGHDPWAEECARPVTTMAPGASFFLRQGHVWKAVDAREPDRLWQCANCDWFASPGDAGRMTFACSGRAAP